MKTKEWVKCVMLGDMIDIEGFIIDENRTTCRTDLGNVLMHGIYSLQELKALVEELEKWSQKNLW